MMNSIIYVVFFLITVSGLSQNNSLKEADEKFENYDFVNAIEIYKSVANTNHSNPMLLKRIGDSYYLMADYKNAFIWYDKLFNTYHIQSGDIYAFKYGQTLKAMQQYEKADSYLVPYFNLRKLSFVTSKDLLYSINKDKFTIEKIPANTNYSEYPAFLSADNKLIIASSNTKNKILPWNNQPSSNLFESDGYQLNYTEISSLSSMLNEGSCTITKDGKTIYFTRNTYDNKKPIADGSGVIGLKIYKAELIDNKWKNVELLPFADDEFLYGHPTLSSDDKTLYFISNLPGGKGETDIYSVSIYKDGTFGVPVNLLNINTPQKEMFPFMDNETGNLYFSSNGYSTLGGLDVFVAFPDTEKGFIDVQNVGEPLNSPFDDFAFVINGSQGFFASNRGTKSDEIYRFNLLTPFHKSFLKDLKGTTINTIDKEAIEGATITLYDFENNVLRSTSSNEEGSYELPQVDCNKLNSIRIEKDGFFTEEFFYDCTMADDLLNLSLKPSKLDIKEGADLADVLDPIYFDYGKAEIREDAKVELEKIINILTDFPSISIEIGSHTDSRGSVQFNNLLSERRAKATAEYIIQRGIASSRITYRGYGSSRLLNNCSPGIQCSEVEHQLNRRSSFIIIKK